MHNVLLVLRWKLSCRRAPAQHPCARMAEANTPPPNRPRSHLITSLNSIPHTNKQHVGAVVSAVNLDLTAMLTSRKVTGSIPISAHFQIFNFQHRISNHDITTTARPSNLKYLLQASNRYFPRISNPSLRPFSETPTVPISNSNRQILQASNHH